MLQEVNALTLAEIYRCSESVLHAKCDSATPRSLELTWSIASWTPRPPTTGAVGVGRQQTSVDMPAEYVQLASIRLGS